MTLPLVACSPMAYPAKFVFFILVQYINKKFKFSHQFEPLNTVTCKIKKCFTTIHLENIVCTKIIVGFTYIVYAHKHLCHAHAEAILISRAKQCLYFAPYVPPLPGQFDMFLARMSNKFYWCKKYILRSYGYR